MSHFKQPAKLAVLILWPLLLLCYGVGNVQSSTIHGNSRDIQSLLDFRKGITADPNGVLSNWNSSFHVCRWKGVNCTTTPPFRVMEIDLNSQSLAGSISSSLGNLTFLRTLDLSNNSFRGPIPDALTNCSSLSYLDLDTNPLTGVIPPSIGSLSKLQEIYLFNNGLTGTIPDTLTNCTSLLQLDLSFNNLTGVIPHHIGLLSNLTSISLYSNALTGGIPPTLGSITTLQQIRLAQNQLNGTIPEEIWQMSSLEMLYLGENSLSGEIPPTLPNISSLTILSLPSNMLRGKVPSNISDVFPSLQELYLGNNHFEGHIPTSLGKLLGLQQIDLSNNSFTGPIPSSFGNLKKLSRLNLENNHLEATDTEGWEFFHSLANCTSLSILSLTNNQLHGAIPNSIANLSSTNLTRLNMGGNHLSGVVPSSIGNIYGLVQLSLDLNNLNGAIEEWIGNMKNLQVLKLESNNFSGTIPPSISHLTQLTFLSLADNNFTGFIPPSLGRFQQMSSLNLSYNNFQGNIPSEIGSLTTLTKLDLSSNKFSGPIPETFGQFVQITDIRMDQNFLDGNIPCTINNLRSLNIFNVSHNRLSGSIPTCLNDLKPSKLDLSYNNFIGAIPKDGVFDNPTVVSLDGNPGLCGGAMDFHRPSCFADTTGRVRTTNYLIKILIPIFGFMSLILLVYFLLLEKKGSRREQISDNAFGEHFENVTYNDLAQATDDFSEVNMIGRGSYGSVYRGKLKESKMEVAVKVFNLEMRGAERSFLSECQALRSIHHRNLLPIITACSTVDNTGGVFKALVYELMPNGNLDMWLHQRGDEEAPPKHLGLTQRINIAVNIADALDYLHHDCGRPTVHCDLKPSNILLDDDMNALLGDFGIARFYADHQSTLVGSVSSIGLKGTIGYIPPEYGAGGHVTTSGDVYSFGIVLLEMFTGKRPTDPMFMDGLDIISFVENRFPEEIFHVIDSCLMEECKKLIHGKNVPENKIYNCLVGLLEVALSCTRSLPSERSYMKQVASKLNAIKKSYPGLK